MSIEIGRRTLQEIIRLPPLPPLAEPRAALARALPALTPPERITVTEAAAKYMRIQVAGQWQDYDPRVAPYMVEPQDLTTSRRFRRLVFVGPSQSGKSQMLMACAAHAICCDPGPIQLNHITSTAAKDWVLTKLEPTLRNSPELAARLGRRKSDDNMFEKGFAGGTRFTIGPPTIEQLSARTRRLMLLSDYDRWADSIGGEGSGATLADARTRTYGSRGMTVIESSPGRARSREDWQAGAAAPHEAPPVQGGILGLYNEGTRARWYWACPGCREEFEPRFSLLVYDREAEPVEAGAQAQMGCPHCGTLIDHGQKPALNATGRWLHETRDGRVVPVTDADLRGGDLVSYWLQGVAATFATWAQLVALYEAARRKFDLTGDEDDLLAAVNTGLGEPYLPRVMATGADIEEQALRDLALEGPVGTCPRGTRFVTLAVDVQANRFVVQAEAWGEGMARTVIAREDIVTPPPGAPAAEGRAIDPARYAEDWAALLPLAERGFPVAGATHALRPVGVIVDSGGAPGVTPNAYAFWRARRKDGTSRRWHLVKGIGGKRRDRVERVFIETRSTGRRKPLRDLPLVQASTDALKDEICAALLRGHEGARTLRLLKDLPPNVAEEMSAERRGTKGWELRPGRKRNEALDLAVYALALAYLLRAEAIEPADPPDWARLGADNARAVPLASAGAGQGTDDAPAEVPEQGAHSPVPEAPRRGPSTMRFLRR